MPYFSKIIVFFYICVCTLYFAWGFTKLSAFYLIFVDPELYIKPILVAIIYSASILILDSFTLEFLKKYHMISWVFSYGILILFSITNLSRTRSDLGDLLFASQPLIKTIYFAIPLILLYVWSFSRFIKAISGKTIFSTIDVGGMEINSYLWFSSLLFMMLSLTIYACIYFSWNKLEIREKGIWISGGTVWEKITDYSWEQKKDSNILRIEKINYFQNKIETKYKISSGNKEKIDKILRDKLKK